MGPRYRGRDPEEAPRYHPRMILFLLSCGAGIPVDGYASTCTQDEECYAVPVGDVCSCSCEYSAVSDEGLEDWMLERDAYFSTDCEQGDACDCPEYEAACGEGVCELR